ncbi:MAG: ABC transporter permease, partial [Myxococcales bacterium]|nr:ABC transporter permease [Myxococcales bacterium]
LAATPLLLTGLAVALAFRGGVWNIGAEGQFILGAIAAVWAGTRVGDWPPAAATGAVLAAGALGGALWGFLAAALRVWRGVHEVIGTIMLNFLALHLLSWLVHGPMRDPLGGLPQSAAVAGAAELTRLLPPTRLHTGVVIALAAAATLQVAIFHTRWGYEVRALGLSPRAARYAGVRADCLTLAMMAVSGALAGLAGGVEMAGVTFRLYENISPGYGYTAIAVALLARLHPGAVVVTAGIFGALASGAAAMQRQADVSAVLVELLQGVVILIVAGAGAWTIRRGRPAPEVD